MKPQHEIEYATTTYAREVAACQSRLDKPRGDKISYIARALGQCSPGCAGCHAVASELLAQAERAGRP